MGQYKGRVEPELATNATSAATAISIIPAIAMTTSTIDPTDERLVVHLRAHPDFTKHHQGYSTADISRLADRGKSAYDDPLTVTQNGYVIECYALWQQALRYIIDRNRGSEGINDFVRILLALELESWFEERPKQNQRTRGLQKGSSQLTEADRVDVRQEIARAAAVSVGNVSNVKHILDAAAPQLIEALRSGEIRISRGSSWAQLSVASQLGRLGVTRQHRGMQRTINMLLKKHQPTNPRVCDSLRGIQRELKNCSISPSYHHSWNP